LRQERGQEGVVPKEWQLMTHRDLQQPLSVEAKGGQRASPE